MTRSHLNLLRKLSDASKTIEHLNNECWKFCAAYHARNEKNNETYVVLLYQMLFIESSKEFANCEVAHCKVF